MTPTMSTHSSLLDTLAEQALAAYQQQESERRKRAEEQRRLAEEQAERDLRESLSLALTPALLAHVQWQFAATCGSHQRPSLFFRYAEADWHLEQARDPLGKGRGWTIYTTSPGGTSQRETVAAEVSAGELPSRLLLALGKRLQQRQEAEAQRRAQQLQQALAQQEEERERAERLAVAQAQHERLTALFEQASRKAVESLWRWPQGVSIEVYRLCYCTASLYQDSGETAFDYDSGWTAAACLDEHHRIRLEPTRVDARSGRLSPARVVQLLPQVHHPLWTVFRFARVEELPPELRESVTVSLPQVVRRSPPEDGQDRLAEIPDAVERYWYRETIGEQPLPWLRALVEQAMAREPQGA